MSGKRVKQYSNYYRKAKTQNEKDTVICNLLWELLYFIELSGEGRLDRQLSTLIIDLDSDFQKFCEKVLNKCGDYIDPESFRIILVENEPVSTKLLFDLLGWDYQRYYIENVLDGVISSSLVCV